MATVLSSRVGMQLPFYRPVLDELIDVLLREFDALWQHDEYAISQFVDGPVYPARESEAKVEHALGSLNVGVPERKDNGLAGANAHDNHLNVIVGGGLDHVGRKLP